MIVHDLDVVRSVRLPDEADPPLVVDANAVLVFAVCLQRLQLVARRDAQAGQLAGGVDLKQLAPGGAIRPNSCRPVRLAAWVLQFGFETALSGRGGNGIQRSCGDRNEFSVKEAT